MTNHLKKSPPYQHHVHIRVTEPDDLAVGVGLDAQQALIIDHDKPVKVSKAQELGAKLARGMQQLLCE